MLIIQEIDLLITSAHRRSCSILQRQREEDASVTQRLRNVLEEALGDGAAHDFDKIEQGECQDQDRESAINIDVDRLLYGKAEEKEEYEDVYGDYEPDAELI